MNILKNPITITLLFLVVMFVLLFTIIKNCFGLEHNEIILIFGIITGVAGYFLVHFLEIQRKQREERLKHYRELVSKIRVFVKEMKDKSKLGEEFDEAYYTSWMTISSNVYNKLVDYLSSYKKWAGQSTGENLEECEQEQKELMKVMRKEFVNDKDVDFKAFDFRWSTKDNT